MIWFTSDLHFGHNNVIKFCDRPFESVHEMNIALTENWNKKIKPKDKVYVLGDFSFMGSKNTKALLEKLNGYKILIWGNHDRKPHKMLELGFDEVYESHKIFLNSEGERYEFLLSHFPYAPIKEYHKREHKVEVIYSQEDLRYLHKRVVDDGESILLHGHTHSKQKVRGRMIHVGVDAWGLSPVSHKQIIELAKRIIEPRLYMAQDDLRDLKDNEEFFITKLGKAMYADLKASLEHYIERKKQDK